MLLSADYVILFQDKKPNAE